MAPRAKQSTEDAQTSNVDTPTIAQAIPSAERQVAMRDQVSYLDIPDAVRFDDGDLRSIQSFDDAAALAVAMFGELPSVADMLGDGFALLSKEDKARLVGVPLILLSWDFYPGDFGSNFAAIRIVARNDDGSAAKFIVNDGSSGIAEMLASYSKQTGRNGGLLARHGFRESNYPYCAECMHAVRDNHLEENAGHKVGRATTYYIDTSL